jgi:hypothetical protein
MKLLLRTILGLLCASPVAALADDLADLAAARARARTAGLAFTFAEIQPPSVPEPNNAAPLIARFGPMLSSLPDFRSLLDKFSQPTVALSPDDTAKLAEFFRTAPVRAALASIREAAAKPGFYVSVQYTPGKLPNQPDIMPILDAARLLNGHAAWLISNHASPDEICTDIRDMLRLQMLAKDQPSLLAQMIRLAIIRPAIERLHELASRELIPAAWNIQISELLSATNIPKGITLAMAAEYIIISDYIFGQSPPPLAELFPERPANTESADARKKYRDSKAVLAEHIAYIGWAAEIQAAITEPAITVRSIIDRLNRAKAMVTKDQLILTKVTTAPDSIQRAWRDLDRITLARVGLALEQHRALNGTYSEALIELVPKILPTVPMDRSSGLPLKYRRIVGTNMNFIPGSEGVPQLSAPEPAGAVIWSAGPNLKDDGGTGDDIVWRAVEKASK